MMPKTVVAICITASKPRAFLRENKSPAPPVKADIASELFLAGCIMTQAIRITHTIKNIVNSKLYKEKSS